MERSSESIEVGRTPTISGFLLESIRQSPVYRSVMESMTPGKSLSLSGLHGSLCPSFIASLTDDYPVILVAPDSRRSEELMDDLIFLLDQDEVLLLPPKLKNISLKRLTPEAASHHRAEALLRLATAPPKVLVLLPGTLAEGFPSLKMLKERTARIKVGDEIDPMALLRKLLNSGFKREIQVEGCGETALRGGILDMFPYGFKYPLRLEFWGNELISLRSFDPRNQRSIKELNEAEVFLDRSRSESENVFSLMDGIVFWDDKQEITERYKRIVEADVDPQVLLDESRISLVHQPLGKGEINFGSTSTDMFLGDAESFRLKAGNYLNSGMQIVIGAEGGHRQEKFNDFLAEAGVEDRNGILTGVLPLQNGFVFEKGKVVFFSERELFDHPRPKRSLAKFRTYAHPIELEDLKSGDLVVHSDYGIGIYQRLKRIKVAGNERECLHIKYRDNVNLYVRIESFDKVRKYVGREGFSPAISKIGGRDWQRTRVKAKRAIVEMAKELLQVQAMREVKKGTSFEVDDIWQAELENNFIHDETPDQTRVNIEIKRDMESGRPMDRLLLGDVGFGKTEIAIRAAFKAVRSGYQAAVLAPTTILVQQHLQTFRERMAEFPVNIEVLSRFKSPAEQRKVTMGIRTGTVDIVIGTHRLLSKDVTFKRLGLLIVDEEHRFGVKHKERIKQYRAEVDVLTLTATPIPRTLHQALMGARELSRIETPPEERLPIMTEVAPFDRGLIRQGILQELKREGQVFFVHNRVKSIGAIRAMLSRIVPEARYGIAHGQMKAKDLEKVMLAFMQKKFDVLICTMIVESGLDISNVNTMIINRADKMGLAQLYQLRGRIGRSDRQAYAYLLIPPKLGLTGEARSRLETISRFTELGAGFQVALKDLEIRGAGNLLGPQQSGFINSVGFELYSQMLEEAINEARMELGIEETGEPAYENGTSGVELKIDFPGDAHIPSDYLYEEDLRVNIYRRLASCGTLEELSKLEVEMTDRFGIPPEPLRNLIGQLRLKTLGKALKLSALSLKNSTLGIEFPEHRNSFTGIINRAAAASVENNLEFIAGPPFRMILKMKSVQDDLDLMREAESFLKELIDSI